MNKTLRKSAQVFFYFILVAIIGIFIFDNLTNQAQGNSASEKLIESNSKVWQGLNDENLKNKTAYDACNILTTRYNQNKVIQDQLHRDNEQLRKGLDSSLGK